MPSWTGALSTLGLLAWTASGTVLLTTGALGSRLPRWRRQGHCFIAVGAFALMLALDDGLELHEALAREGPTLLAPLSYALYATGAVLVANRYGKEISRTDWPVLVLAVLLLGASVLFEGFVHLTYPLEDSLKLAGLTVFLYYSLREARRWLATGTFHGEEAAPPGPEAE